MDAGSGWQEQRRPGSGLSTEPLGPRSGDRPRRGTLPALLAGAVLAGSAGLVLAVLRHDSLLASLCAAAVLGTGCAGVLVRRGQGQLDQVRAELTALAGGDVSAPVRPGPGDLAGLDDVLAALRAGLAAGQQELRDAHDVLSNHQGASHLQQQRSQEQLRDPVRETIEETTTVLVGELDEVVQQVEQVRVAALRVDERMTVADTVTQSVVRRASEADDVAAALTKSLEQVGGMVRMIASVADQTRMLALNATIEAARAGDAGKGFAVVAGEVKDLAVASANWTEQITGTIASLETDVAAMLAALTGVTEGISGIDDATTELRQIAADQQQLVHGLDRGVHDTITRLHDMADLADRLERRRHSRVPATGPVRLHVAGRTHAGALVDLSLGGLRCTPEPMPRATPGTPLRVELATADGPLEVDATVAHRRHGQDGDDLHLQFAPMPDQVRARLARHLDQVVPARDRVAANAR